MLFKIHAAMLAWRRSKDSLKQKKKKKEKKEKKRRETKELSPELIYHFEIVTIRCAFTYLEWCVRYDVSL